MTMSIFDHEILDDTHDYYDVTFYDDEILTLVTHTPSIVDMWMSDIERIHRRRLRSLVVGLDVEWRPNYGRDFNNPVATLQLCVGHRCLVFQILHSPEIPWSLRDFLGNRSYTFTGVGIGGDVNKLRSDYDLVVAEWDDIGVLAAEEFGRRELRNAGLKGLTEFVLGKELIKPRNITMSRWDKQWLSPAQVQYACIDAFLSFEIGKILITGDMN